MARYVSDLDRTSRWNHKPDPLNPTHEIRWITASSPEELERVFKLATKGQVDPVTQRFTPAHPRLSTQLRLPFSPARSTEYRTKSQAVASVDVAVLPTAVQKLHLTEIPESYFAVQAALLRKEYFVRLWNAEHLTSAAHAPDRPTLDQITRYHDVKIRYALVNLLSQGEWIDDPTTLVTTPDDYAQLDLSESIAELNQTFRRIPLGRQSHLQFSSNPGQRRMFGKQAPNPWLRHPHVTAYLAAPPQTRPAMLAADSSLATKLSAAGLPL